MVRALWSKQRLIALDNCEHLTAACATLAEHPLSPTESSAQASGCAPRIPRARFDGFILFTPSAGGKTVYLIDMEGEVAHTWEMPIRPAMGT